MWAGSSLLVPGASAEIGVFVLVSVGVLLFLEPLFARRRAWLFRRKDPRALVEEERTRVLRALKDLEFEHRTGKMSEAELEALRGPLYVQAAELTRELDRVREEEDSLRGEVERAVGELREPAAPRGGAGR